jgi:hypothetical protein
MASPLIRIPAGLGYKIQYRGNWSGDFGRATEAFTAEVEQEHQGKYIFRLPDGRRAMTDKAKVEVING